MLGNALQLFEQQLSQGLMEIQVIIDCHQSHMKAFEYFLEKKNKNVKVLDFFSPRQYIFGEAFKLTFSSGISFVIQNFLCALDTKEEA